MEDFVQKFQEHADRVCEILQKEPEWIKRYKGYADTLHNRNNDRLKFRCPGELFPYINITTAIIEIIPRIIILSDFPDNNLIKLNLNLLSLLLFISSINFFHCVLSAE